jgi:GAF domain-containing protein
MEPVPETEAALNEYLSFGDNEARHELMRLSRIAEAIVPDLVGMSVTMLGEGITFTVVATDLDTAAVDAAQYADDGPCERSLATEEIIEQPLDDLLSEGRWHTFALVGSANGVASSLSLPILSEGTAVIGLNLYASTRDAFTGRHRRLADGLGASVSGVVTNADLAFSTRLGAVEALARLDEQRQIDVAIGTLASSRHVSVEEAEQLILTVAARAGVLPVEAAKVLVAMLDV